MQRLGRMLGVMSPVPFVLARQAVGWPDTPKDDASILQNVVAGSGKYGTCPQLTGFDFRHSKSGC